MAHIGTEIGALGAGISVPGRRGARVRPVDFQRLLGAAAWATLPAAVQHRFSLAANARPHSYVGAMEVRASTVGLLIAQVLRLVGTPLATFEATLVPVRVEVRTEPGGAVVWDRAYTLAGGRSVRVSSKKAVDARGRLMEIVRGGLGMKLDIAAVDGALHFRSRGYFVQVAGLRLPIPALITPGEALVIHEDRGRGWFRFTLRFVHPWLGETFFQTGLFRDPDERRETCAQF